MSVLDGLTILRYGHVYDAGGGVEQYLVDLNRTLQARNSLQTIQVQLTSDPTRVGETHEGRLQRVALFVEQASHERAIAGTGHDHPLKTWLRDRIMFRPWIYPWFTRSLLSWRRTPRRAGEPNDVGRTIRTLHARQPLDLICLHSAGGADTEEILAVADTSEIPVVYVHHFANDRLSAFSIRAQARRFAGVAGVCGVDVPDYLRGTFQNVSDGIDTDFFRLDDAARSCRETKPPIIFLPARITPAKGQADLLRAAGALKRRGVDFRVILAGRTDSAEFLRQLEQLIQKEDLADRVEFAGQLGPAGLRDWYAAASVMAFPTRHHEGLPRILLECQAMEVVPVVHDIGGTAEGVREGKTGYVIKVGDFDGLVDRLAALLHDRNLRAQMGRAGRRLAEERFSLTALAGRHEQFYHQILAAVIRAPR